MTKDVLKEKYMTVAEAGRRLGISRYRVFEDIARGKIKALQRPSAPILAERASVEARAAELKAELDAALALAQGA